MQEHKTLVGALIVAQSQFQPIVKDQFNESHGNKYASLDSINRSVTKPLNDNGLLITSAYRKTEEGPCVVTTLRHVSGEFLENPVPVSVLGNMQSLGSAIKYARRYGICGILNVTAEEEDDGNASLRVEVEGGMDPKMKSAIAGSILACKNPTELTILILKWASSKPIAMHKQAWGQILPVSVSHAEAQKWPRSDDRDKFMRMIMEFEQELAQGISDEKSQPSPE